MANKTAYKDVFKSITVVKNEHDLPQITKDDEVLSVRVLKKVEGGESISSNVSIDIFKEVMRVESTKFYNTIEERDADTVNLRVGNFAVVKSINNVSILYTDKTWFRINDEIKFYDTIEARDADTVNLHIGSFAVIKSINNASVLYTDRTWFRINGGTDNLLMLSQDEADSLMKFDSATKEVDQTALPSLQKIYDAGKDNPNLIVIAPLLGELILDYKGGFDISASYTTLWGADNADELQVGGFISQNIHTFIPVIDNVVTKTGSTVERSQVAINKNEVIRLNENEEKDLVGDGTGILTDGGTNVVKKIINSKLSGFNSVILSPTYGVLSTQMTDTTIKIFGNYTTDIKDGKTASNNILTVSASFTKSPTTVLIEGSKVERLALELGSVEETNRTKIYATIEERDLDTVNLKIGDFAVVKSLNNVSVLYTDRTWYRINGGIDNLLMLSQEELEHLMDFDQATKEVKEASLPTLQKIYDVGKDNPNLIVIAPTFGVFCIGCGSSLIIRGGYEQLYGFVIEDGTMDGFIAANMEISAPIIDNAVTKTGSKFTLSQVAVNNNDTIRLDKREETALSGDGTGVLTEMGGDVIKRIVNTKLYNERVAVLSPTYGVLSTQMTDTTIKIFGSYTTDIKNGKTASNNILIVTASFTKDPTTIILEGSKVEVLVVELGNIPESNKVKFYETIEARDLDTVNLKIGDFAIVKSLNNVSLVCPDRTLFRINGGTDNLLMLSQEEAGYLMDFDPKTHEVSEHSLPMYQKIYDAGKNNPNLIVVAPLWGVLALSADLGGNLAIYGCYEQIYHGVEPDEKSEEGGGFNVINIAVNVLVEDNVVTKTGSNHEFTQVLVSNNDIIRLRTDEERDLIGFGYGALEEDGAKIVKKIINAKLNTPNSAILSPTYGTLSVGMTNTDITIVGNYIGSINNGKTATNVILKVEASFTKNPTTIILEGSKIETCAIELGGGGEGNKTKIYETIEARDADVANLKNGDGAIVSKVSTSEKPLDGARVSKLSFNTNHIPDLASYITSPDDKFEDLIPYVGFGETDADIGDSLLVINLDLNKNLIATGSPKSAIAYRVLIYDIQRVGVPPSYIIMYSDTDFTLTPSPDLTITGSKGWNNSTISFDTPTKVTYATIALGATYDFVWTDIDECFASKTVVENVSVWNGTNFLSTTTPIVQTSGQSTTSVMSQKSVTDLVNSSGGLPILETYGVSPLKTGDSIETVYTYFGGKNKFEAFVNDAVTHGSRVYKVHQHYSDELIVESISGRLIGFTNSDGTAHVIFQHSRMGYYAVNVLYTVSFSRSSSNEWGLGEVSLLNSLDLYDGINPNFHDYMAPTAAYVIAELAKKEGAPDYTSTKEISINEYWLEPDGVTKRQVYLRTFTGVTPETLTVIEQLFLTTNKAIKDVQFVCGNIGGFKPNWTILNREALWSYRIKNGDIVIGIPTEAIYFKKVPYTLTFKYTKI